MAIDRQRVLRAIEIAEEIFGGKGYFTMRVESSGMVEVNLTGHTAEEGAEIAGRLLKYVPRIKKQRWGSDGQVEGLCETPDGIKFDIYKVDCCKRVEEEVDVEVPEMAPTGRMVVRKEKKIRFECEGLEEDK